MAAKNTRGDWVNNDQDGAIDLERRHRQHRRTRKRPRKWQGILCLGTALSSAVTTTGTGCAAVAAFAPTNAFTTTTTERGVQPPPTRRLLLRVSVQGVAVDDATDSMDCAMTEEASTTSSRFRRSSDLPPWLARYAEEGSDDDAPAVEVAPDDTFVENQIQSLESLLHQHGFDVQDVREVEQTIWYYHRHQPTSGGSALVLGMVEFVQLLLAENYRFDDLDDSKLHHDVFASKSVVLAGMVHYAECVAAREEGVYDWLQPQQKLDQPRSQILWSPSRDQVSLTSYSSDFARPWGDTTDPSNCSALTLSRAKKGRNQHDRDNSPRPYPPALSRDPVAQKIAKTAARIKRSEILAHILMGVGHSHRLSQGDAEGLRGLLLSNMEDWRALAIRCVASLFRLEGILEQQQQQQHLQLREPIARSPAIVHTAHEARWIYATLAGRLGMHKLKAKLEERAFRILYQRQYQAVSTLYHRDGLHSAMQAMAQYLSTQIEAILRSDPKLMDRVESIEVSSRVKEPYSFWKKLLKSQRSRKQRNPKFLLPSSQPAGSKVPYREKDSKCATASYTYSSSPSRSSSNLSVVQVHDSIALRIILQAKKESLDESDEAIREREKLLCYYVQHLIQRQWRPLGDKSRSKDYIRYPKPNGYQSLHYTASLKNKDGRQYPFEVQVRSKAMHQVAEYGVAAHWDYKLAGSSEHLQRQSNANGSNGKVAEPVTIKAESSDAADALADDIVTVTSPQRLATYPAQLRLPSSNSPSQTSVQSQYIDALVTARQNLMQQRVYVFVAGASSLTMERGQLVILDSGARIRDVLDYLEAKAPEPLRQYVRSQVASVMEEIDQVEEDTRVKRVAASPRVLKNGRQAQLDETVRNSDVLLIEL